MGWYGAQRDLRIMPAKYLNSSVRKVVSMIISTDIMSVISNLTAHIIIPSPGIKVQQYLHMAAVAVIISRYFNCTSIYGSIDIMAGKISIGNKQSESKRKNTYNELVSRFMSHMGNQNTPQAVDLRNATIDHIDYSSDMATIHFNRSISINRETKE